MTTELGPRKLATIMAVDLAGYSALAETDEAVAIDAVERVREHLVAAAAREGGRIFNTAGDSFMLEFASASGALTAAEQLCAVTDCNKLRIGLHLCDVIMTPTGDMLGHGVNIAARLQQMAKPGAVLVSVDVRRAIRGALAERLHAFGPVHLNKMEETIEAFTLGAVGAVVTRSASAASQLETLLAVLPFDNHSKGADLDFFADGVADEIMVILMRQTRLKVVGRTSAFQFRGKEKSAAAATLRASHVLDGVVRRTKTKLRINAQLIETRSGLALWSQHYDRTLADAFDLQDEIAAEVARALSHALAPRETRSSTIEPAAYDLYLRARRSMLTLSDVEEEHVETLLERCVARAPDFADAWAALGSIRAFLLPRDRDVIGEPAHNEALNAAERALALHPDHPRALEALALLLPGFGGYAQKLDLTQRALQRAPHDAELHVAHATWLYGVGRVTDALAALDVAAHLEPRGPAVEALRASLLAAQGDLEGSLDVITAAWSRWPDSAFVWYIMWVTLCAAGKLDEAEALAAPDAAPKSDGVALVDVDVLRTLIALLKSPEAARQAACAAHLAQQATLHSPLTLSTCLVAANLGCADQALDVVEQALARGRAIRPDRHDGFGMARAQSSLQLFVRGGEAFRRHPRFPVVAARLGLAQYWLKSGHWPDCADVADYDFRDACAKAAASLQSH